MKSLSKWVVVFFMIICWLSASAQNIESALASYAAKYSPEKIYIHYDKEYYVAGETIWFKAYLYYAGKPSGLSNNFYLQLYNEKGTIVCDKKYPINGATVKGDIQLPDSLSQGYYTIRAMTPHMLNVSPDFLYSKVFFVFNPSEKADDEKRRTPGPALSVQFFPESGYLLDGVTTVLAFKATDSLGQPAAINGIIKMDDTVNLSPFSTYHAGIGRVLIKPHYGKKYTAAVTYNGRTHFFPLPDAVSSGINLHIEDEKEGKIFLINRTKKEKDNFDKVLLVVQAGYRIVYENEVSFDNYLSVKGHLGTDSLPSGILHFTVFSKEGLPLVERIAFVDNREYEAAATINIEKKGIEARSETIAHIVFPDTMQRSCSVSATVDEGSMSYKGSIITSLLLTEDIKGYIADPGWYFKHDNDSAVVGMDNLLLTHGWSRFVWKKILAGDFPKPVIYEDKYLISVSGYLKDSKTKENVSGGRLSLFLESEDSLNQNFDAEVDASGKFNLDSLLFRGKTKMYYGYTSPQGKEKTVDIYINRLPADSLIETLATVAIRNHPFEKPSPDENLISQRYLSGKSKLEEIKELDPVMVKTAKPKRPLDEVNEQYSNGVFKSLGRVNIDNITYPENDRSISVYDFIRRSINNVTVEDDNFVNRKNFSISSMMTEDQLKAKQKKVDSLTELYYRDPRQLQNLINAQNENAPGKKFIVALFLNESPAYAGIFKTIRMDEVALIKYYEPGFIGVSSGDGPGGALAVYTKKNISAPGQLDKLDHIDQNGYSLTREFYSPDYSKPPLVHKEDKRTTLFWSPDIFANAKTDFVELRFFNNDSGKKIRIIFEGFDINGKLTHAETVIEK